MAVQVLSGKCFLLVTGASQGIGSQIAVTFGHLLEEGSQILLLARNISGLKNAADKIPKHVKVDCESVDLSVATADVLDGNFLITYYYHSTILTKIYDPRRETQRYHQPLLE